MRISYWSSDVCSSDLLIREHRDLTVEQCHVDMRPRPRDVTTPQRGKDRHRRIHAGEDVGIGDARLLRGSVRLAGQRHEAAHRLDDIVIARAVSIRSEEHTSELPSLMRISYAVFCLKKKNNN